MPKSRQEPDERKLQILSGALELAAQPGGYSKLTRESVAKHVQCSDALISKYFGTMLNFKRTIMRSAILKENLSIVAQGLAVGDVHALKADKGLRAKALATLAG